jgi:hypothetical protein
LSRRLLDSLTEEEYFRLRELHGPGQALADKLGVSLSTVQKWKQRRGIHTPRTGNRKPRMSTSERLEIYNRLKDSKPAYKIADELGFATANSMGNWLRIMKKEGRI